MNRLPLAALLLTWLVPILLVPKAEAAEREQPLRVATLLLSVEAALQDVEGVEIVASIRRSMRAPARSDVIDLGSPHHPSVEQLVQARPDLVVGDALANAMLRETLGRAGSDVFLMDTRSPERTLDDFEELGRRVDAGAAYAARVEGARQSLRAQAISEPVEVLALFGTPGTFQVVTSGAWLGSLLEELRFTNVGSDIPGKQKIPGYVEVSHEHLATLRPDLVLLVAHGEPRRIQADLNARLEDGPWSRLAGARHGVHVLSPELFLQNPGLDLPRAAEVLVEFVHNGTPAVSGGPAVGAR